MPFNAKNNVKMAEIDHIWYKWKDVDLILRLLNIFV